MRTHLVVAGIIALAGTNPADAATITIAVNGSPAWVHVTGEFLEGDGDKFKATTRDLTNAIVVLESDGGNAIAGLVIGSVIRVKKFTTLAWRQCASACATAWLGGVKRMMFRDSRVGFTAQEGLEHYRESTAATALKACRVVPMLTENSSTFGSTTLYQKFSRIHNVHRRTMGRVRYATSEAASSASLE
jgi:hypothetical protein